MDIKLKYKKVFYDLYKSSKGLLAYTLYKRYNVQPTDAIEFINQYVKQGIITIDDEQRICLTSSGRNQIEKLLKELIPEKTQSLGYLDSIKLNETIRIFEPYLPNIDFYDRYTKERRKKETSK